MRRHHKSNIFILVFFSILTLVYWYGTYYFFWAHIENHTLVEQLIEHWTPWIWSITRLNNTWVKKTYIQDPYRWYIFGSSTQFTYNHEWLWAYKQWIPVSTKRKKQLESGQSINILYFTWHPGSAKVVKRSWKIETPPHKVYWIILLLFTLLSWVGVVYNWRTGKTF